MYFASSEPTSVLKSFILHCRATLTSSWLTSLYFWRKLFQLNFAFCDLPLWPFCVRVLSLCCRFCKESTIRSGAEKRWDLQRIETGSSKVLMFVHFCLSCIPDMFSTTQPSGFFVLEGDLTTYGEAAAKPELSSICVSLHRRSSPWVKEGRCGHLRVWSVDLLSPGSRVGL